MNHNRKLNKLKNMKRYLFIFALLLGAVSSWGQTSADFIIIDQSAPNLAQLLTQYNGQSNMFFNENPKPAPYIIPSILEGRQVVDLHIFVEATPGTLSFGSGAITAANADTFIQYFDDWTNSVSGNVVVHNTDIFTTSAGAALKAKLEQLTSLVFTTQ